MAFCVGSLSCLVPGPGTLSSFVQRTRFVRLLLTQLDFAMVLV
jgi:hypothetical protein